jgi:hypothetical protein
MAGPLLPPDPLGRRGSPQDDFGEPCAESRPLSPAAERGVERGSFWEPWAVPRGSGTPSHPNRRAVEKEECTGLIVAAALGPLMPACQQILRALRDVVPAPTPRPQGLRTFAMSSFLSRECVLAGIRTKLERSNRKHCGRSGTLNGGG